MSVELLSKIDPNVLVVCGTVLVAALVYGK